MRRSRRKTAPKVKDGRVQHKNCWSTDRGYASTTRVAIDRRRAGYDYRHAVTTDEVYRFISIIPDWENHARGLDRIILDEGSETRCGWYSRGQIAICAMPKDLQVEFSGEYFYRDIDFFRRFEIPVVWEDEERRGAWASVTCHFNSATARYYVLVKTLLHELGHHLDLMTNRKRWCSRGEDFAEGMGREIEHAMFGEYCRVFGHPTGR